MGLVIASILNIDGSFLFIFVSIVCLIYILNHTLFRPINQVLEERERLGVGRSAEAKRMLHQYEERVRRYEEHIRATRAEAYQRMENRRRELLAARQQMIIKTREEVVALIAKAREEITAQTANARAQLNSEASAMALNISSQILKRPVASEGVGA